MTVTFPVLLLIAGALCFPAYLVSRGRGGESRWLLFASLPAIAVWVLLTGFGYGPQSLSNLIEVFGLLAASIVLCYLKVFLLDRQMGNPKQTTYLLMALLVLGAFLLRTFMPLLPE